ncbi:transcription termination factor 1, mitochondrial isoform X1 [Synchiropus splendidus]|uniref:transcription termination factor 1, mitochondrial isoform X1 n=2 Tax=Synchiropus splendidus TaxID=270530 RepID=UPI00237EB742|nr:transcription termination factor 1, mitochondrial isoform X1 [Synchiropus splendidus]
MPQVPFEIALHGKMAVMPGIRCFSRIIHSLTAQQSIGVFTVPFTSSLHSRILCSETLKSKPTVYQENESLLENLNVMGVDLKMARQRQPGVLRKLFTNEKGLAEFLKSKGASKQVIAGIISRYPRAITRSIEHLEHRWQLWRTIFKTDSEIVAILHRSPESFFRSSDNGNLEKNVVYLSSLGLDSKDLHRLLTTAPRTFSNRVELNKQMVELLEDICVELGGRNPEQFAKAVISKNLYILIRSTKRVRTNVDNLRSFFNLTDSELLALIQGRGAEILDLSNEYVKNNFKILDKNLRTMGCLEADIKKLIAHYPMILYIGSDTLSSKLDCLMKRGITLQQILEKPKVLDFSTQNITEKFVELEKIGYDFKANGIGVLDLSRKRFDAKMKRLIANSEEKM